MRENIYNFLVNRYPEICERYHRYHDDAAGMKVIVSWIYLLWLNIWIHLPLTEPGRRQDLEGMYERKHLPTEKSESRLACEQLIPAGVLAAFLESYDVISFDIFDTLLFRPFSEPADLFYFVGGQLEFMDFRKIRIETEKLTREQCMAAEGHPEVTLRDIWRNMEKKTGIPAERGMEAEMAQELYFCRANPYMLEVVQKLREKGKRMIAVSDMYLPGAFLEELLKRNGFTGIEKIYVSCEYGKNKAGGSLYDVVKAELPEQACILHVGDNHRSDIKMAEKHGFKAFYYPNINRNTASYRAKNMSPVIGGAYRGVVNSHLYNGIRTYSMEYEYGFIYGGIFVLGYCNFIHEYCRMNRIDKLLFLSRDGDILKRIYGLLYPRECTEYVYWSRAAATKLMAAYNRYDYFQRFLYHKVNQNKSIEQIFTAMELLELLPELPADISGDGILTARNVEAVKAYLEGKWDQILERYQKENVAAKHYYEKVLAGCSRACAVDIGWAGSGAMALSWLVEKVWELPCRITGVVAGTNTRNNASPDAAEPFLQSGKLVSYLYSASYNRDLWNWHNPNRDDNLYWELLLASGERTFLGFGENMETGEVEFHFGRAEKNPEGILEIQRGIRDFVQIYCGYFKDVPGMLHISGRDAYAPMLAAAGFREEYLKKMLERFEPEAGVGDDNRQIFSPEVETSEKCGKIYS